MLSLRKTAMLQEAGTKLGLHWALECVMFVAVWLACQIAVSVPVAAAGVLGLLTGQMDPEQLISNTPDWLMLVSLYSTIFITVITVMFCLLLQKRRLPSLGFRGRHALREYLLGGLIGAALFAAAVGICACFGAIRLEVSPSALPMGAWLLFFFGFLIQGMSEEVLCRGYFMPSVARRNPVWLAVLLNSLLFSLLHIFNSGVTALALLNIFLFGVLLSVYVLRRGDLWGACAMHSIWNFVQGNVFGVSVSGTGTGPSLLHATFTGSELWTGGAFGLEGGLAVTLALATGLAVLLFLVPDSGKRTGGTPERAAV